jgi:hypothetical protein
MDDQGLIRCANCGTRLAVAPRDGSSVICPVCHFANAPDMLSSEPSMTLEAFEARLGELHRDARASGLLPDDIVHVLRDELEFAAELANRGRDLCVQIVDLGPRRGEPVRRTGGDSSPLLRGRTAGA